MINFERLFCRHDWTQMIEVGTLTYRHHECSKCGKKEVRFKSNKVT